MIKASINIVIPPIGTAKYTMSIGSCNAGEYCEDIIPTIVNLIDEVIMNYENKKVIKKVKSEVNELMSTYPIFV